MDTFSYSAKGLLAIGLLSAKLLCGQQLQPIEIITFPSPTGWLPNHHEVILTSVGAFIEHPKFHILLPFANTDSQPKLEMKVWKNPYKSPYVEIGKERNILYFDQIGGNYWLFTDHLFSFDATGELLSKSNRLGPRFPYSDYTTTVTREDAAYGHAFGAPEEGIWLRPGMHYSEKDLARVQIGEEIVMWRIFQNQSKAGAKKMKFREMATISHSRHDTTWRPCDWESFGTYSRDQKLLYITYNDAPRIDIHDLQGKLIKSISHAVPLDPLTPSKRDKFANGKPYERGLPRTKPRYSKIFLSEDGKTAYRIHHFGATEEEMELLLSPGSATARMAFHSAVISIDLSTGETKQYPVPKGMYVVSIMGGKVCLRKADERPGDIGLHVYQMTE